MGYPDCYPYNESDGNIRFCIKKREEIDKEIDEIKTLPSSSKNKTKLVELRKRRILYL